MTYEVEKIGDSGWHITEEKGREYLTVHVWHCLTVGAGRRPIKDISVTFKGGIVCREFRIELCECLMLIEAIIRTINATSPDLLFNYSEFEKEISRLYQDAARET